MQFHPNSSYLATGSTDKTVRLWAVADAKLVRVFPGHKGAIQSLAFSPDGKLIASAGITLCSEFYNQKMIRNFVKMKERERHLPDSRL